MWIKANHEKIRYTGRIDWSRPEEPLWVYPCTSAEFRFTGSVLKIYCPFLDLRLVMEKDFWISLLLPTAELKSTETLFPQVKSRKPLIMLVKKILNTTEDTPIAGIPTPG